MTPSKMLALALLALLPATAQAQQPAVRGADETRMRAAEWPPELDRRQRRAMRRSCEKNRQAQRAVRAPRSLERPPTPPRERLTAGPALWFEVERRECENRDAATPAILWAVPATGRHGSARGGCDRPTGIGFAGGAATLALRIEATDERGGRSCLFLPLDPDADRLEWTSQEDPGRRYVQTWRPGEPSYAVAGTASAAPAATLARPRVYLFAAPRRFATAAAPRTGDETPVAISARCATRIAISTQLVPPAPPAPPAPLVAALPPAVPIAAPPLAAPVQPASLRAAQARVATRTVAVAAPAPATMAKLPIESVATVAPTPAAEPERRLPLLALTLLPPLALAYRSWRARRVRGGLRVDGDADLEHLRVSARADGLTLRLDVRIGAHADAGTQTIVTTEPLFA